MNDSWPRDYFLRPRPRLVWTWAAGTFCAACLAAVVLAARYAGDTSTRVVLFIICGGFLFMGLWALLWARRSRVRLFADGIEVRGALLTRRLERHRIVGRRLFAMEFGPPVIRLAQRGGGFAPFHLPQHLQQDERFQQWMADIADLDAEDTQRSLDDYLAHAGAAGELEGKEGKLLRLDRARRIARTLNAITVAGAAWAWFHPVPYDWAMAPMVLLPWLAALLAARGEGAFVLNPRDTDVRARLLAPLMVPPFVLALRGMLDFNTLDWPASLLLAGVGGAVLTVLVVRTSRELRDDNWNYSVFALFGVAYCYGLLMVANVRLDRSEPRMFITQVIARESSSGNPSTYTLTVRPWGPVGMPVRLDVARARYEQTSTGDQVCVYLSPGALRMRWYEVWECG